MWSQWKVGVRVLLRAFRVWTWLCMCQRQQAHAEVWRPPQAYLGRLCCSLLGTLTLRCLPYMPAVRFYVDSHWVHGSCASASLITIKTLSAL